MCGGVSSRGRLPEGLSREFVGLPSAGSPSARGGFLHRVGKETNTEGFGPCTETITKFIRLVFLISRV